MCFFRYIFPCKEWIEVTKNVNSKYAKKLKVKDIEESMMSSLKSQSLNTYSTHIVYLYCILLQCFACFVNECLGISVLSIATNEFFVVIAGTFDYPMVPIYYTL